MKKKQELWELTLDEARPLMAFPPISESEPGRGPTFDVSMNTRLFHDELSAIRGTYFTGDTIEFDGSWRTEDAQAALDEIQARVEGRDWEPHREVVIRALAAGKPVPAKVLKDYPELKTKNPSTAVLLAMGAATGAASGVTFAATNYMLRKKTMANPEPIKERLYKCSRCGYITTQKTNHTGSTWSWGHYHTCPECPPWAKYPEFGGQTIWIYVKDKEDEKLGKSNNGKFGAMANPKRIYCDVCGKPIGRRTPAMKKEFSDFCRECFKKEQQHKKKESIKVYKGTLGYPVVNWIDGNTYVFAYKSFDGGSVFKNVATGELLDFAPPKGRLLEVSPMAPGKRPEYAPVKRPGEWVYDPAKRRVYRRSKAEAERGAAMNPEKGYAGWKNRETWNVALWMGGDESWYGIARQSSNYAEFVGRMRAMGVTKTPDGYSLTDKKLDRAALNEVIKEFHESEPEKFAPTPKGVSEEGFVYNPGKNQYEETFKRGDSCVIKPGWGFHSFKGGVMDFRRAADYTPCTYQELDPRFPRHAIVRFPEGHQGRVTLDALAKIPIENPELQGILGVAGTVLAATPLEEMAIAGMMTGNPLSQEELDGLSRAIKSQLEMAEREAARGEIRPAVERVNYADGLMAAVYGLSTMPGVRMKKGQFSGLNSRLRELQSRLRKYIQQHKPNPTAAKEVFITWQPKKKVYKIHTARKGGKVLHTAKMLSEAGTWCQKHGYKPVVLISKPAPPRYGSYWGEVAGMYEENPEMKMSRWVERKGKRVEFGNIVGPFVGHTYYFSFPTEKQAKAFEKFVSQVDAQGIPVAVPEKYAKYRVAENPEDASLVNRILRSVLLPPVSWQHIDLAQKRGYVKTVKSELVATGKGKEFLEAVEKSQEMARQRLHRKKHGPEIGDYLGLPFTENPRKPRPEKLGVVWPVGARLYDGQGRPVGTCLDTPNAIAKAMMEHPKIESAHTILGVKTRADYIDRMQPWNTAKSHFVALKKLAKNPICQNEEDLGREFAENENPD